MLNRFGRKQAVVAAAMLATAAAAYAATLYLKLDAPVVVSTDDPANNAFKAKMGWISYKSDPALAEYDIKAQLLVYADGPAGQQNIWIARSADNGATWTQTKLTTNGGTPLTLLNPNTSTPFIATNNKPNIYVAPVGAVTGGKGADALVTWTASDCQGAAGQQVNLNLNTGPQPFMCLYAARSVDGGVTWSTPQRLTDGTVDPDEDVPAGYAKADLTAGGFAISFQADPAGLQQGEAEGPGDGASGAKVSAGTNIWYTFLSKLNFENGNAFPTAVQVSDNNSNTVGDPGASRANLAISGGTTVLAYEETKAGGGKQIVYHSFPYATPQTNNAGNVVSDPAKNARRVRFVLQGNDALLDANGNGDAADGDTKGVHVLLLWRESVLSGTADAPADIIVRRGIKNTTLRGGSTGFLASDVVADPPVNLTDPLTSTDNALAHRAVLRGDFAAVAYDYTPDKAAADVFNGTYNLFITRSTDGGDTWGTAVNMSKLTGNSVRVVEPRLVGTPGTIKRPDGSATADPSDVQDRNVLFVAWGTETNDAAATSLDIYITRSTDQGVTYEDTQLLAGGTTAQAEAQLRSPPDGKTIGALWMQQDVTAGTTDVVYRNGVETAVPVTPPSGGGTTGGTTPTAPESSNNGGGGGCTLADGNAPFDPMFFGLMAAALAGMGWRRRRALTKR